VVGHNGVGHELPIRSAEARRAGPYSSRRWGVKERDFSQWKNSPLGHPSSQAIEQAAFSDHLVLA